MKKEDIIRKITSRKFWIALIGFISALLVAFNVDSGSIEQITSIIMSFASLIAYIVAEGIIDSNNVGKADDNDNIDNEYNQTL